MKISGFTIIKNAIINDYPVVEAITSILPVVDEMIVLVGDCEDDTEKLVRAIDSDKIRIHHSVWNKELRKGGAVLADETNKAFQLIDPASTWAFYIQADEILHEKYVDAVKLNCEKYAGDMNVSGLLFKYLHFYGTYDYVGDSRRWYSHETRIIRNDKTISAYRDAQGFRRGNKKINVKEIDCYIYHYGWVKGPKKMREKQKHVGRYWNTDDELKPFLEAEDVFNFDDFDSLKKFEGTHPAVLHNRLNEMNWKLDIDISKKRFSPKDKLLHFIEKKTGKRLFDFSNHHII